MSDSELNDPNLTQQSNSSVNETIQKLMKQLEEQEKRNEEKDKQQQRDNKRMKKQLEEKDKQLEEKDIQQQRDNKRMKKQIQKFPKISSNYTTNDNTKKFKFPPLQYNQGVEPSVGGHNKGTDGQIQCAEINEVKTDPIVGGVDFDVSNFPFFEIDEEGDLYDIPSANFSHNKGGLTYENEAGVQHHTLQMVKDAIMCAGLGKLYEPHLEFSMFSVRPDIIVVQTKEIPRSVLMCIKVKSPGKREKEDATKKDGVVFDKDVFRSEKVAFQMFNHLMTMKQLGSIHPIACLSTYDQMCMTFLEDPNEFPDITKHVRAVQKHVANSFIVEKVSTRKATNSKEEGPSQGKNRSNSDASRHTNTTSDLESVNQESEGEMYTIIAARVHYTAVKTCDIFPYLVSTMLLAYELSSSEGATSPSVKPCPSVCHR